MSHVAALLAMVSLLASLIKGPEDHTFLGLAAYLMALAAYLRAGEPRSEK